MPDGARTTWEPRTSSGTRAKKGGGRSRSPTRTTNTGGIQPTEYNIIVENICRGKGRVAYLILIHLIESGVGLCGIIVSPNMLIHRLPHPLIVGILNPRGYLGLMRRRLLLSLLLLLMGKKCLLLLCIEEM